MGSDWNYSEIGLDFHYNHTEAVMQTQIFHRQLALAVSLEKPIIIHSRKAEKETLEALKEFVPKDHKIHLHMFNESEDYAKKLLIDFPNLYFGLTGSITFHSASSTQKVVQNTIPADRSNTFTFFFDKNC